jgi:histidine triad (HIT) family protein
MSDCVFCKIVAGEIPSIKVYEDKDVVAFLDIQPVSVGHTLIIPKEHSDNLGEMTDEGICPLFLAAQKVSKALKAALDIPAYNLVVNVGEGAGQIIHHTHVHVIPRYPDDGLEHWPKVEVSEEQLNRAAEKIRRCTENE